MFPVLRLTQGSVSINSRKLEVSSNNLSNVDTPGFHKLKTQVENINRDVVMNTYISTDAGVIKEDGDPHHMAILGEGYFLIDTEDGDQLRRGGDFMLSPRGELVTPTGERLLSQGGPIILADTPTITGNGTIIVNGTVMGRLDIVKPEDPRTMVPTQNGNYTWEGQLETIQNPRIVQGAMESSNTNAVHEMTTLIELTRSADIASRIFRTGSEMLKMASTEVGKIE